MSFKQKNIVSLFVLLIGAVICIPALAGKVKIPAKAISPRSMMVFYIDYDNLTLNNIKATLHIFTSAIPEQDKTMRQQIKKAIGAQINKQKKLVEMVKKDHVHALVMIVTPAKKVLQTKRGESGARQRTLVTKQPASKVMLFLGGNSTTATGIVAAMKQMNAIQKMRGQENKVHKNPPKISRFTENWFIAEWSKENESSQQQVTFDVPEDAEDAQTTARFNHILNSAKDAAVRVVFVPNAIFHNKMAALARIGQMVAKNKHVKSDTIAFGSLYGALSKLQYALASVKLGKSPALEVKIEFTSANAAQAANKTIMQLYGAVQKGLRRRVSKMKTPPSAKLIKALFQELKPTVKGNMLKLGIHKPFLENLAQLAPVVATQLKILSNQAKH